LDAESGKLIWRKGTGNWVPSLSGWGKTIYFGSANTEVHALGDEDGEPVWRFNIPDGTFNYGLGAPTRIAGELYFLTQQGDIMALNAEEDTMLWTLPSGAWD
jgi:outer membrane protein assembly factor BamB